MADEAQETWVFHRGALGDSVLLWPMLRAQAASGRRAVLVTDRSKAMLAAAELGIEGVDAEQRRFNELWLEGAAVEPVPEAHEVVAFVSARASSSDDVWISKMSRMFPQAAVMVHRGRPDSILARRWSTPPRGSLPPLRRSEGAIVCHIGAGAEAKRWPLERFVRLADELMSRGRGMPLLIAGEVESERMAPRERTMFEGRGGRFIFDLQELASVIRSASLFIGNDSGPTHLAAQLGIPCIALFGPTDPLQWGPVGPGAAILAPPAPCAMDWLRVEQVVARASSP